MLILKYLKQHVGLLTFLIFLINCVSFCSSSLTLNNDNSDLIETKQCDRNCTSNDECCSFYYCGDGRCRKPGSNIAFIVLAKISLETTFAIILTATFVFLMRGLLNQAFRRQQNNANVPSSQVYPRECFNMMPPLPDVRQDKPPSYEECVRPSQRETPDLPPPYFIPVNYSSNLDNCENCDNLKLDTTALEVIKSVDSEN